jgi:nicotinamidase/pyrazinamidase
VNALRIRPRTGDALLLVDVQQDCLPGGALAVPGGDNIIEPLNRYLADFRHSGLPVVATRDYHPANHCSFREQGGPWPPHCVVGTSGVEFASGLALPRDTQVISKATTPQADAYSGFQHTQLAALLRARGCRRLFIGGLATDYCVQATVLDALREGFEVVILTDAIRAVDRQPGDGARALATMMTQGARVAYVGEVQV